MMQTWTASYVSRGAQPWLCLLIAWMGMAVLWGGHALTRVPAEGEPGVEKVSGVVASVRVTRMGGAFVRVASDDGTHFVMLGSSLGRVDGVAVGCFLEASGIWHRLGRLRVLQPCSRASVRVGPKTSSTTAPEARDRGAP